MLSKKTKTEGATGEKLYHCHYGVGTTKYTVSAHDGIQTHNDGSPFFDIRIFTNKKKRGLYLDSLRKAGYTETC